jgi:hypothetical protein
MADMMNARTCFEGEFLTLFFSPSTTKSLIKIYIRTKKMVRILLITKTNVVFDIIMNLWSCRFNYWFPFVVVLACKLVRKTRIGFHLITLERGSRFNYISLVMIIKMNDNLKSLLLPLYLHPVNLLLPVVEIAFEYV